MAGKRKKKQDPDDAVIVCIWCYERIQPGQETTHPCIQPDFLDTQPSFNPHPDHPSVLSKKLNKNKIDTFTDWYATSTPDYAWRYEDMPPWISAEEDEDDE